MRHIPLLSALLLIPVGIALMNVHPTIGAILAGVGVITSTAFAYDYFRSRSSASESFPIPARQPQSKTARITYICEPSRFLLVEMGGVEPPSESTLPLVLHA